MKKKKPPDSKAWASFRIRGIQTTLGTLAENKELHPYIREKLCQALEQIEHAVKRLDEEREANENNRNL